MDQQALAELAASIRSQGLMQPLLVRPVDRDRYELIAGERRWRAAQMAGLEEVPVVVYCPACATERTLTSVRELRCPACGEPTPTVVTGRELASRLANRHVPSVR